MNSLPRTDDRIVSIDALRAVTMLLMIWVNDFWTLVDIPHWLQHMPADVDALGFSDIIFPAFLFIVGLSIPYAIRSRRARGEANTAILAHIGIRTASLLVMGWYMVNLESYSETASGLAKPAWQVLMTLAFFLIWNIYPQSWRTMRRDRLMQGLGWAILIGLAVVFRSGEGEGYHWMQPHWWGILGLIGWAYGISACAQLLFEDRPLAIAGCWLALSLLNVSAFAGWLDWAAPIREVVWVSSDGALPAMTMGGVLVTSVYLKFFNPSRAGAFVVSLTLFGMALLIAGLLLRPAWGISKIGATPAWTQICTGIGVLSFAVFYWFMDIKGYRNWYRWLKPAGVATLTCYLVPYLVYPFNQAVGIALPESLRTGAIGLTKSMLFALLVIALTGVINRLGVRLKI